MAAAGELFLRQICTKKAFLLMIVEEKPTMTRAVEAGIAAAVMLAAWMYMAAATEIQNPYFHPPHGTEIQNPYFHPPQTSAPTPDGTPPDVHPERCKYLEQHYFDCADRNGASQCKVEDDARLACVIQ